MESGHRALKPRRSARRAAGLPGAVDRSLLPALVLLLSAGALLPLLACLAGCAALGRAKGAQAEAPPQLPYDSIVSHLEAGDVEAALQEYRDYLEGASLSPQQRLLLARLLLAAGRFKEARTELERMQHSGPPSAEVLIALAHLEASVGQRERQESHLRAALSLDQGNPDALAALGLLLLEEELYQQAESAFRQALERNPRQATALRGLGTLELHHERYRPALELFDRALEADPANALTYADRARARTALEDRQGAIDDLSQAIRLDPGYYWSYIDRGKLFLRQKRWEEAHRDFSAAVAIDAGNFLAYVYRAGLNDRLDRVEEAVADYRSLLALNPAYHFAYAPLAQLHYLQGNWSAAAEAFRRAWEYDPEEPSLPLLAALSLRQDGRRGQADTLLNQALRSFAPDSWPLRIARYLLNPALEDRVVSEAGREGNKLAQARMLFYIASQLLLENRIHTALRYLLVAKQVERADLAEVRIARALLERFGVED